MEWYKIGLCMDTNVKKSYQILVKMRLIFEINTHDRASGYLVHAYLAKTVHRYQAMYMLRKHEHFLSIVNGITDNKCHICMYLNISQLKELPDVLN